MKLMPSGNESITSAVEPNNHYHLTVRTALQLEHSIGNFPYSIQHHQIHTTNLP